MIRLIKTLGWTGAAALFPSAALAEVCDKERPDWGLPPATMLDEAIYHFTQPFGLFLLGATAVAILFRHSIGVGIACVMWAFYVTQVIMGGDTSIKAAAIREGCAASPALFVGLVAAICLAAVLFTIRREKRL